MWKAITRFEWKKRKPNKETKLQIKYCATETKGELSKLILIKTKFLLIASQQQNQPCPTQPPDSSKSNYHTFYAFRTICQLFVSSSASKYSYLTCCCHETGLKSVSNRSCFQVQVLGQTKLIDFRNTPQSPMTCPEWLLNAKFVGKNVLWELLEDFKVEGSTKEAETLNQVLSILKCNLFVRYFLGRTSGTVTVIWNWLL